MGNDNYSSKSKVLALLQSRKGDYVSGEDIASEIGISRTAVWKAIKRLQSEGYRIDAVTNKGYRLSPDSDVLSAESIWNYYNEIEEEKALNGRLIRENSIDTHNLRLRVFDTIDSTNAFCLKKASEGESGGLIAVAGSQSRGRGRRGRSFFSPGNSGLYMSILLRPFGVSGEMAVRFTTIAAVAVAEAIEAVSDRTASIKWVNDIYVDKRKVCGILTEASFNLEDSTLDYAVVGIGINVYEPVDGFPDNIRDIAGAIAPYSSDAPDGYIYDQILSRGGRNRLAAEILARFYGYCISELGYHQSENKDNAARYIDEYRRRCFVVGHEVNVLKAGSAPESAFVTGIDDNCRLEVRYSDGRTESLNSGEISIKLQEK